MGNLLACISAAERHTGPEIGGLQETIDELPGQDLLALLQCLQGRQAGPPSLGTLEAGLANFPHAILVVQPAKVPLAAVARLPTAASLDEQRSSARARLSAGSMSSYIQVVRRLEEVAASPAEGMEGGKSSIAAQLEAINIRQPPKSYRRGCEPASLSLLYANAAAHEVLGADMVEDWVDLHISHHPMLLCQLSYQRKDEPEVYQHLVPVHGGGFLQLDAIVCPFQGVNNGADDLQQALLIRLKHQPASLSRRATFGAFHKLQQQQRPPGQQQKGPHCMRETKSMDAGRWTQRSVEEPGGRGAPPSRQCLYLALAHLPMAVTLVSPSGQIVWQNGRSAALLGLARLGSESSSCDLTHTFNLDPDALDSLLLALKKGEAWNGLVQVWDKRPETAAAAAATQAGIHVSKSFTSPKPQLKDCRSACTGSLTCTHGNKPHNFQTDARTHGMTGVADNGTGAVADFSFPHASAGASEEAASVLKPMYGYLCKDSSTIGLGQASRMEPPDSAFDSLYRAGCGPMSSAQVEVPPRIPSAVCSTTAQPAGLTALRTSSCAAYVGVPPSLPPRAKSRVQLSMGSPRLSSTHLDDASMAHDVSKHPHDTGQPEGAAGPRAGHSGDSLPLIVGRNIVRRRSVHTSSSLHELDQVLPRALQMSTSPPSSMMHPLSRTSDTVANCSLNWLAHTQDQVTSGAHYFDAILEGGGTKSTQDSTSVTTGSARLGEQAQDLGPMDRGDVSISAGPTISHSGAQEARVAHSSSLASGLLASQSCGGGSRGGLRPDSALSEPASGVCTSARDQQAVTTCSSLGRKMNAPSQTHSQHLSISKQLETQQEQQQQQPTFNALPGTAPGAEKGWEKEELEGPFSTSTTDPHGLTIGPEQDNVETSPCWHVIDAFHIKGPDNEHLMVVTSQDVTHWVDAQLSLKQILDVEHKLLENIFPKHVLESQVAACTETSFSRSQQHSQYKSRPASNVTSHQSLTNSLEHDQRFPLHRSTSPSITENLVMGEARPSGVDAQKAAAAGNRKDSIPLPQVHAQKLLQPVVLTHAARSGLHQGLAKNDSSNSTPSQSTHINCILASQDNCAGLERDGPRSLDDLALQKVRHTAHACREIRPVRRGNSTQSLLENPPGPVHSHRLSSISRGRLPPRRTTSRSHIIQALSGHSSLSSLLLFDVEGSADNGRARSPVSRSPARTSVALSGMGRYHENVTVMFADIKNFTAMSRAVSSVEVMHFLHTLFSQFDSLVDSMEDLGLYKVETIGDCYMCAAGLLTRGEDGAMTIWEGDGSPVHHLFKLATDMLKVASDMEMPASGGQPVVLRIGMHTGPCVSGIVGTKMPRFCLYGDTVNFAARMESACKPGMVHVSQATWEALGPPDLDADPHWSATPGVEAKGIGCVQTYLWSNEVKL